MTLQEALTAARGKIDRLDARLLLQYATGCSHTDLLMHPEMPVLSPAFAQYLAWVERRAQGEPFAYLVGEAEFRGRIYQVTPDVLIPRPETEVLVELAKEVLLERAKTIGERPCRLVDLGTGSGIVAISLALECPEARVSAVDISAAALNIAQTNAGRLGATLAFLHGDWFSPLAGQRFDLVVSNPPYVAENDPHLALNGLPFEPLGALTDGEVGGKGLACLRQIIAQADAHLWPGGALLLEHGHDQGEDCRNLLEAAGFKASFTRTDLAGLDRVSGGFKN